MPVGKINKYGVPIGDEKDQRQGLLQPKFVNRFRVKFRNMGVLPVDNADSTSYAQINNEVITGAIESFTKPEVTFEKQKVHSFISSAHYAGRPTLGDFSITIRDEITNTVISKIYNQLKMQTYKYQPVTVGNGGGLHKSTFLGLSTKFDVILEVMDGRTNHKALERWEFYGCEITSYSTSTLSYQDTTSINIINLGCSFDYFDVTQGERLAFASQPEYEESDAAGAGGSLENTELPEDDTPKTSIVDRTTSFIKNKFS